MSSKSKKKKSTRASDGKAVSSASTAKPAGSTSSKPVSSSPSSRNKPAVKKRTTLMTVAIVVIVLHGLIAAILYSTLSGDPDINRTYLITLTVIHFLANVVAAYGIYIWKKWGLQLYAYSAILGAVTGALAFGIWTLFVLILPLVILGYIFKAHYDQFE
jgi:hypothetical protein